MPKALMKLPRTNITRAGFRHSTSTSWLTTQDRRRLSKTGQVMDETDVGVICKMDGGFGKTFDGT